LQREFGRLSVARICASKDSIANLLVNLPDGYKISSIASVRCWGQPEMSAKERRKPMRPFMITTVACGLMVGSLVQAQNLPTIDVGHHLLQPDQPNQLVTIDVGGGVPVQALDLNVQVADGGPVTGGMIVGPGFTADILTGTIFAHNYVNYVNHNADLHDGNQYMWYSLTTDSGTVETSGLLATLVFDTTGFSGGSWPLIMSGTIHGNTNFGSIGASIINGSISIVPEPASAALAALGFGGLAVWVRRRKSH
jgi:MYXO-CTERM domain-containing protein